jgi:CRISPR/Cas system-associated exonuclease Cas4 (RecB family)
VLDLFAKPEPTKLVMVDYKTGKERDEHTEQLDLYALAGFKAEPEVEVISSELWYLDQGAQRDKEYTRDQVPKLLKYWDAETRGMMRDTRFDPKPGEACRWCSYAKVKGGPCQF